MTLPLMQQCPHKDWFQVGSYLDGARNTTGVWRAASVYPQLVDAGSVYASKDLAMKDGAHYSQYEPARSSGSFHASLWPRRDPYISAMLLR